MTRNKQHYLQEKYRSTIRLPHKYTQLKQDLVKMAGCTENTIRHNIHLLINTIFLGID